MPRSKGHEFSKFMFENKEQPFTNGFDHKHESLLQDLAQYGGYIRVSNVKTIAEIARKAKESLGSDEHLSMTEPLIVDFKITSKTGEKERQLRFKDEESAHRFVELAEKAANFHNSGEIRLGATPVERAIDVAVNIFGVNGVDISRDKVADLINELVAEMSKTDADIKATGGFGIDQQNMHRIIVAAFNKFELGDSWKNGVGEYINSNRRKLIDAAVTNPVVEPTPEVVEPETTAEIVSQKNKATLVWSEASEIENKDFESLNELQQFMRDEYENDASKLTTSGYDKHQFNVGRLNGIRVNVSGDDEDFNPFKDNLSKYLKNKNLDVEIEPDLSNLVGDKNSPIENTVPIEPAPEQPAENTIAPEITEQSFDDKLKTAKANRPAKGEVLDIKGIKATVLGDSFVVTRAYDLATPVQITVNGVNYIVAKEELEELDDKATGKGRFRLGLTNFKKNLDAKGIIPRNNVFPNEFTDKQIAENAAKAKEKKRLEKERNKQQAESDALEQAAIDKETALDEIADRIGLSFDEEDFDGFIDSEYEPFLTTAINVENSIRANNGVITWDDFSSSLLHEKSIFDSVTIGNVCAQFGTTDGVVAGRAEISKDGALTLYTGANGSNVSANVDGSDYNAVNSAIAELFSKLAPTEPESNELDLETSDETPETLITAPNGSNDFGEINAAVAKAIGRQGGKIRLQLGKESPTEKFGISHIESKHKKEIEATGLTTNEFVYRITSNPDAIRKAGGGALLLEKDIKDKDKIVSAAVVRLKPDETGDFYRVETAFVTKVSRLEKKYPLLWEKSETTPSDFSNQTSFAALPPDEADEGRPNGTLEQSGLIENIPQLPENTIADIDAELESLKSETDYKVFDKRLDDLAAKIEDAGLMDEYEPRLNELADILTKVEAQTGGV